MMIVIGDKEFACRHESFPEMCNRMAVAGARWGW